VQVPAKDGKSTIQKWRIKPDQKEAAIDDLGRLLKQLAASKRDLRRSNKLNREIFLQRRSIPAGEELDRLQRYETAIKRDRQRTIDLLERIQRRRRGEPSAPTVNVNLSRDN